jgi:hypothetical protein
VLSSTGNQAMMDEWSLVCRLWTAATYDDLPLYYSFLADLGGAVGDIVLREFSPQSFLSGFVLPSSRTLLWGQDIDSGQGGWYLCRVDCPLTLTAVIMDGAGASRRASSESNITRPGCKSQLLPCNPTPLLDLLDAALNAVDVGGPDPEQTNYQLLIISLELSDIQSFSLNASDPAATRPPPTANPILALNRRTASLRNEIRSSQSAATRGSKVSFLSKIELSAEEIAELSSAFSEDILHASEFSASISHSKDYRPSDKDDDIQYV